LAASFVSRQVMSLLVQVFGRRDDGLTTRSGGRSDGGAEHWATVASLIETCKLNDIDPLAYLTDALTRIVNGQVASELAATSKPRCGLWRPPNAGRAWLGAEFISACGGYCRIRGRRTVLDPHRVIADQ
jgi:IS66 C-terminal element